MTFYQVGTLIRFFQILMGETREPQVAHILKLRAPVFNTGELCQIVKVQPRQFKTLPLNACLCHIAALFQCMATCLKGDVKGHKKTPKFHEVKSQTFLRGFC